jgi:hypothetical protein
MKTAPYPETAGRANILVGDREVSSSLEGTSRGSLVMCGFGIFVNRRLVSVAVGDAY